MVFTICEGISCSSFYVIYVKEFDVIVHKVFSLYNPIKFLAILYLKSPANLVVEVGTKHTSSHKILFERNLWLWIFCQIATYHCGPKVSVSAIVIWK